MSDEEFFDKAENAVAVEDELAARRHEAAITDENEGDGGDGDVLLLSPPVTGTSNIKQASDDEEFIYLHLMDELPNGADTFPVPIPSRDEIHDESHELNRLLSWYGLDADRVGDITGERLPLRPKGDYGDPESMRFEIDYPPVQSRFATARYRLRRTGERLGLLRWGKTPAIEYDRSGDVRWLNYTDGEHATAMPRSAHGLLHPRAILPEDTETVVPTHRGMAAILAGIILAGIAPAVVLTSLNSIEAIFAGLAWTIICLVAGLPVVGFAVMGWFHHLKETAFSS